MSSRFRHCTEHIQRQDLIRLVSLQVYCKNQLMPGISLYVLLLLPLDWVNLMRVCSVDDVNMHLPKSMTNSIAEDLIEEILSAVKQLTGVSFKDSAIRFLAAVKTLFPGWFASRFEAVVSRLP